MAIPRPAQLKPSMKTQLASDGAALPSLQGIQEVHTSAKLPSELQWSASPINLTLTDEQKDPRDKRYRLKKEIWKV